MTFDPVVDEPLFHLLYWRVICPILGAPVIRPAAANGQSPEVAAGRPLFGVPSGGFLCPRHACVPA